MYWHVYLDESGKFLSSINEPSLIGGFIFESEEESGYCKYLDNCLKKAARGQARSVKPRNYPEEFHSTEFATDNEFKQFRDWFFGGNAENSAKRTIFDKHSIIPIIILWTQEDKAGSKKAEDVYSEDHFDMRYRNMLRGLVREIIEKCPSDTRLCFHIPTREAVVDINESTLFKRFAQKEVASNSFRINEPEAVRAMILEVLSEVSRHDVIFESLEISSINYREKDNHKREGMAGYYLADLICDYIKSVVKKAGWKRLQWDVLLDKLKKTLGNTPYALIYGDAYKVFVSAANCVRNSNMMGFLECKMTLDSNEMLYCNVFKKSLERIMPVLTNEQIESLDDEIYTTMYKPANYPKAHKYYQALSEWIDSCGARACPAAYKVLGRIMCCYHHEGDVPAAQELFQSYLNSDDISPADLITITNQHIGMYEDMFEFAVAENEIEELISFIEDDIQRAKERANKLKYTKIDSSLLKIKGRVLSNSARMMAYQGKTAELIDKRFEEAVSCFNEDAQNAAITLLHRLHYHIMNEDFDLFSMLADHAFGSTAGKQANMIQIADISNGICWLDWYEKIMDYAEKDRSASFQLYLYLKSLYLYQKDFGKRGCIISGIEKVNSRLFSDEYRLENDRIYDAMGNKTHPFELIYRYLSLLAFEAGKNKIANRYKRKMTEIGDNAGNNTIGIISKIGRIKYGLTAGWTNEILEEERNRLLKLIEDTITEWKCDTESTLSKMKLSIEENDYQYISKMLLYEYD